MNNEVIYKWMFIVIIVFAAITYVGCEQKNDMAQHPENNKVTANNNNKQIEQSNASVETKTLFPDLKGTWSGTFDGRSSVLNILEQSDSSFSGKITTNYRQVMNQDIKGTLTLSKMEITMTDQLQNRSQGKYNAVLSSDMQMISGTFTIDRDGSKYTFNLKKK